MGKNLLSYQIYMDKMQSALNQNIQDNIAPYWRNHQSLKGWTSMNYPTVIENALLKKRESNLFEEAKVEYSNLKRPISGYKLTDSFIRPFSTKEGGETLM